MNLKSLRTYQFRNLEDAETEFSPGVNLIRGQNAQGKTNLLEAIYLLANGKSFRASALAETVTWEQRECSVMGQVEKRVTDHQVAIRFSDGKKAITRDANENVPLREYLGTFLCLSFIPGDLALISGSPSGRRKFLDRYMVMRKPSYLQTLGSYQRALRNKNQLLKQRSVSEEQVHSWNVVLSEHALRIEAERYEFIQVLLPHVRRIHAEFAPTDQDVSIELAGCVSQDRLSMEEIANGFESALQRELTMRSCVFGPQRDDMKVEIAGHDARVYASQGQTRSLVLSLLLAVLHLLEEEHSERPVVLLDDVESELDEQRLKALFEHLVVDSRQVFISGTNKRRADLYKGLGEISGFEMQGGVLSPVNSL